MSGSSFHASDVLPIVIALDVAEPEAARALVEKFRGIPCWFKVGMELYYSAGPDIVNRLKAEGHCVFLDLKLHDIPNTVRSAAKAVARLGVDMLNVHAAGGTVMMRAALEGFEEGCAQIGTVAKRPILIAVTQLTSTSEVMLREEIGIAMPLASCVVHYAKLAQAAGLHGVVCSAHEASAIKAGCGPSFVTVTPGIRPQGADAHDQVRIMTPATAIRNGSDYLVIGRAITGAPDPRAALERIVEEIKDGAYEE
jgi:orotidine-5'-phosphate decarboxylase